MVGYTPCAVYEPRAPHTRASAASAAKRPVFPGSGRVSQSGHRVRPVRYTYGPQLADLIPTRTCPAYFGHPCRSDPYDDLPAHTSEYMGTRPVHYMRPVHHTASFSAAPAAKCSVSPGSDHVRRSGHHRRPVRYVCPMHPGQRGLTTTRPGPLDGLV